MNSAKPSPTAVRRDALLGLIGETTLEQLAERLALKVKLASKYVGRQAHLPHHQALDVVAQAGGFGDWPLLSKYLASAGSKPRNRPESWFDTLAGLLILAVPPARFRYGMPLECRLAFAAFAGRLSTVLQHPLHPILDGVCAPLAGAIAWADLAEGGVQERAEPLYEFHEGDEYSLGGAFQTTLAGDKLAESLDARLWDGADLSEPELRAARRWLEATLKNHPDFLEGGLALAGMQADAGDVEASLGTARLYSEKAEVLIPKDFRGKISWYRLGNRMYLRLLWQQMRGLNGIEEYGRAAIVARKILRLNVSDNQGARYVLPLLLLAGQDIAGARRALRRIGKGETGLDAGAIRAFVAYAEGDIPAFRRLLLEALFTLPVLRSFLDPTAPASQARLVDAGFRGVIPDLATFHEFGWPAYLATAGLPVACVRLINEPEVQAAEAELHAIWRRHWRAGEPSTTHGTGLEWRTTLHAHVERLAGGG